MDLRCPVEPPLACRAFLLKIFFLDTTPTVLPGFFGAPPLFDRANCSPKWPKRGASMRAYTTATTTTTTTAHEKQEQKERERYTRH
eukprot:scaffold9936_cov130-Isochrysis_galbana.AAC.12